MKTTFVDTSYYLALLNADDQWYAAAIKLAPKLRKARLVATRWVLMEVADALRDTASRGIAGEFIRKLVARTDMVVVSGSDALFDRGLRFYEKHRDKEWSLTDCVSFVVMQEANIREALAFDKHFHQAGFRVISA